MHLAGQARRASWSGEDETPSSRAAQDRRRSPTVVVVDDEPITRRGVRKLLEARHDLDVVGDADSGAAALEVISRLQPDVIVLDMQLPDMCGLDVWRTLTEASFDRQPLVVFVTAFDEFAGEAFACSAADYLVKPFTDQRLMQAVDRALIRLREKSAARSLEELIRVLQRVVPSAHNAIAEESHPSAALSGAIHPKPEGAIPLCGYRERFLVSIGARDAVVETANIAWIRANGYYATLVMRTPRPRSGDQRSGEAVAGTAPRPTERSDYLIRVSLDRLERELDPATFLRIHRSAIVRIDCIRGTERTPRRGLAVVLEDGTRITVSRGRRAALLRALGRTN